MKLQKELLRWFVSWEVNVSFGRNSLRYSLNVCGSSCPFLASYSVYVATDLTFSGFSRPSLGVWVPVHPGESFNSCVKSFDSCVKTLQMDEQVGRGLSTSQAALICRDHCGLDSGPSLSGLQTNCA